MFSNDEMRELYIDKWFGGDIAPDLKDVMRKLPHIVAESSSVFMREVSVLTHSKPAPWPAEAMYDDDGRNALGDENELPFDTWTNKYNQEEFINGCDGNSYYGFNGNTWILIDSCIGETKLMQIFGRDYEFGTINGTETLIRAALQNLEILRWFMLADIADAEFFLFVCSENHRDWINKLKQFTS